MKNQNRRAAKTILISLLLVALFSLLGWVMNPAFKATATAAALAREPYPIGDPYPPPPTVVIKALEVIQVTRDQENPVPLIARKPTVVLVAVECGADFTCRSLRNGMVLLYGLDEANNPLGEPLAPVAGQSGFVGKAFTFQLPQTWLVGRKTLKVKIGTATHAKAIEFVEAQGLRVLMVPVRYQHGGLDKTPNLARIFNAHWWAARVLPTADLASVEVQTPLLWTDGCLGVDCADASLRQAQATKLALQLEHVRTVYNRENNLQSGQEAMFVFGWLPAGTYGGSYASLHGTAAFGDDDPQVGAQIFAHAFGRMLGRPYTKAGPPASCGNPEPLLASDWPATYPDATIQAWGLDATALLWKDPAATYDYMSHCWLPGQGQAAAWTSPHTYRKIYEQKLSVSASSLAAEAGMHASSMLFTAGRAPEVTVLSPNGGEHWPRAGSQTITWRASDADGDGLSYTVLYGLPGRPWMPLAVGIDETHLVINLAELAGGNARIRVVASDGTTQAIDESDASFTVERKVPQSLLLSPSNHFSISAQELLLLHGQAYDLEDYALDGTAFRWTSNIDGELGTAGQLSVALSTGSHLITLTATDSDGNVATEQVNVTVAHKVYLPNVQR